MQIKPENLHSQIRKYKLQMLEFWPLDVKTVHVGLVKKNSGLRGGHYTHSRTCFVPAILFVEGTQEKWLARHPLYRQYAQDPYKIRRK
jgi:hypothetical protein